MKLCKAVLLLSTAIVVDGTRGKDSCPCLPADHARFKLSHNLVDCGSPNISYADKDGKCVVAMVKAKVAMYPTTYGIGCGANKEPGHPSCWNVDNASHPTTKVGDELPKAERQTWCDDPWCYVDECSCDDSKASESTYFQAVTKHFYSYATCGAAADTYTTSETKMIPGAKDCKTDGTTSSSVRLCTMHTWAAISLMFSGIVSHLL